MQCDVYLAKKMQIEIWCWGRHCRRVGLIRRGGFHRCDIKWGQHRGREVGRPSPPILTAGHVWLRSLSSYSHWGPTSDSSGLSKIPHHPCCRYLSLTTTDTLFVSLFILTVFTSPPPNCTPYFLIPQLVFLIFFRNWKIKSSEWILFFSSTI